MDIERFKDLRNKVDWKSLSDAETDEVITARLEALELHQSSMKGRLAKREGYLIERIADMDNLRRADMEAQRGKTAHKRYIRRHNSRREKDLRLLQRMILRLEFAAGPYSVLEIVNDNGKRRRLAKQNYFPWRILHHAIMQVVNPIISRSLIYDTFACIKGKGLHFGVRRMKRFLRRNRELKWFWKTDYKKFYESIPHDAIMEELRWKFKDEHFLKLVEIALLNYESDTSIGEEVKLEWWKTEKRIADRRLL